MLLQRVFSLARFQWPGLEQLSPSKRYWQACLVATLLAVFNPATVGLLLWQGHPTVRCMLQMLLTGVFKFPPLSRAACGVAGMDKDEDVVSRTRHDMRAFA